MSSVMDGFPILIVLFGIVFILQGQYLSRSPDQNLDLCCLAPMQPVFEYEYYKTGDVIIGGIFSVHKTIKMMTRDSRECNLCTQLDVKEYEYLMPFFFAIDEINNDPNLLPNITLGYHLFDSCAYPIKAIHFILRILSGYRRDAPNYSCIESSEVVGFVGDSTFLTTLAMAEILNVYQYTQISHRASDPLLSNREKFPNFYRTAPSSRVWYEVVIKVLKVFEWNWVGIITSDDGTGETELQELRKELTRHGICIEFVIYLTNNVEVNRQKMMAFEKATTNVVVVCGHFLLEYTVFCKESNALRENITLILNQSWNTRSYPEVSLRDACNCSLLPIYPYIYIPGLDGYIENVHPSTRPADPLLEDIWLSLFNCLSPNERKNEIFRSLGFLPNVTCTGTECIAYKFTERHETELYFIYTAVYVLAHALNNMKLSRNTFGKYGLRQKARCNDPCLPGYRKSPTGGIHACCYHCVACSDGEFSNKTDSETCYKCPDDQWPDGRNCIPKGYDYLSYETNIMALAYYVISILCSAVTVYILTLFILLRDTPIVKANNRTVSFILLTAILLSFLCVFFFLGRPVDITCMLRQISFGIFFSIAVSSILAKTIIVCIAFRASKPGSYWKKWVGEKTSNYVVIIGSSVQVVICVIWLSVSPPYQEYDMHSYPGKIIIQCNEGSVIGFYSMLGYTGLLAAVSFIIAFLARTLPDSFNEAKYITFSMLVFCSVWIAMIPAYLSTRGKYMVAVEIFAILASSAGLLGCIFFPKCYIIIIKPERNYRKYIFDKVKT
ncbi:vomeronasal type-2 receptor 26-like [Rana temporaria]|uniref:vomeronasal type-2 receptor 26-like n=1 Tax=Rana temporaria TaxID=8407 RepID=UPI001AADC773|nr:vomeronasal type-2 receptor 26-like [Rana temporaria]